MKYLSVIFFSLFSILSSYGQQSIPSLDYPGKNIAGLVGNGKYLIRTQAHSFSAVRGMHLEGSLQFRSEKEKAELSHLVWNSTFFPGGVEYTATVAGGKIRLLYGVSRQNGYTLCIESPREVTSLLQLDAPEALHIKKQESEGKALAFYMENVQSVPTSYEEMKQCLYAPYTQQLVLQSPDAVLNKAVLFSQYLLDLSDNGEMMLCELFRWLDTWARDLGSGLLPGGLATGRSAMARKSLVYDLQRYARMNPTDCKNSNDPSQGGTSSGIGWTARSIWKYYLYSGDRHQLAQDAAIIRPWVKHWTERDYDGDGLIIDVTEFMDHMIMMLTTNGVTTLAANAMYAGLLHNFSLIEKELGNNDASAHLQQLYDRTVNAINTIYWNEEKGYFNNMKLWDIVSERSSQASQSQLLKIGATDPLRTRRTLDYLKKNNWNEYGSITIVPRMNHVPLKNDQNVKIWPWWNLWESEARFACDDKEGGYHLLQLAAGTIRDEKYPGLLEETLDLEGRAYGGNAFPTGAGNLLDVTVKDLLGVEPLKAGWEVVKVVPSVPDTWHDYACTLPSPGGTIRLRCVNKQLTVEVNDPRIKAIQTIPGATVTGATKQIYKKPETAPVVYHKPKKKELPPMEAGRAVLFYDPEFHAQKPNLSLETIDVEQLATLDISRYQKLVITHSQLPLLAKNGKSIRRAIEHFVTQGGTVVLYGATTNAKCDEDGAGILGEQGGLIDWYQYLPVRDKQLLAGWQKKSEPASGKQVYTTRFTLHKHFAGKPLQLEIGPLLGLDSVYVNGVRVGHYADMAPLMKQEYPTNTDYPHSHTYKRVSRLYTIATDDAAYRAFHFGETNTLTIEISKDALQEGLTDKNTPSIGIQTTRKAWQPIDEDIPNQAFAHPKRKGVNYWGKEQFFNSWSTKNGLFGFSIQGKGIRFADETRFPGLADASLEVATAYTDFALFAPWLFEPLAYTTTSERLLYPMEQERYPCIVRIVHAETKGGYIVITPAIVNHPTGEKLLREIGVLSK